MYEVNRSVFMLIPLPPFWNWLNSLPDSQLDGITLEDLQADANAYLVPACENAEQVWEEISERVEEIFAAELTDWCEDQSHWPDLHPDIFGEWFAVELSSIVMDLSSDALARDAFEPLAAG